MQISIINGSVEYDGEPILSEINFSLHDGEKVAIVGRNGCGKTTLLKAITGEVEMVPGTGESSFGFYKSGNPVIGCLRQTSANESGSTMEEEILSAYSELLSLEKNIEVALRKLENSPNEKNSAVYSDLHEKWELMGGYTYKKEYMTAVRKFGFSEVDMQKPLENFSGGQRTKIGLLKLLLSKPQVLILDEPTNHLDLGAIEWLEKYLTDYKNACVIVSHDRMFLDKIVHAVYDIEYGEMKRYNGNYTAFVRQKQEAYDKAYKDSMARKKEIERLTALVDRFRYKANKAKMAQAKLKQIERIGAVDIPVGFDNATFHAFFRPEHESVEKTIVINKLKFGYGDTIFGNVDTVIKRGQKLGIIGQNGCGKSTFVKTLMGSVPPIEGSVLFGLHAKVGYFDQTLTQIFSPLTVFEYFHNAFPRLADEEVRRSLGAFLFTGDDVFKTVADLSGGEKVRLALCKIFRDKPNVLILDEPTNHMDIIGKNTLESMLNQYDGTVVTVSHDRYFINKICDRLLVFENGKAVLYDCTYSEYEKIKPTDEGESVEKKPVVKKAKPVSSAKEKAKKQHRIEILEGKISVFEEERTDLQNRLSNDPTVFSDYKKVEEINARLEEIEREEAPYMDEWETLMAELESL